MIIQYIMCGRPVYYTFYTLFLLFFQEMIVFSFSSNTYKQTNKQTNKQTLNINFTHVTILLSSIYSTYVMMCVYPPVSQSVELSALTPEKYNTNEIYTWTHTHHASCHHDIQHVPMICTLMRYILGHIHIMPRAIMTYSMCL